MKFITRFSTGPSHPREQKFNLIILIIQYSLLQLAVFQNAVIDVSFRVFQILEHNKSEKLLPFSLNQL